MQEPSKLNLALIYINLVIVNYLTSKLKSSLKYLQLKNTNLKGLAIAYTQIIKASLEKLKNK
jgi:hypothetical protein